MSRANDWGAVYFLFPPYFKIMRLVIVIFCVFLVSGNLYAQGCCSGGSGSPIAGGASQGVLQERQFEIAPNYQYLSSNKFKVKDKDTIPLFDNLSSNYLYLRLAYGVTDKLTMSVESGYFLNKTQVEFQKTDTIKSSGIGDLILFPRYSVYIQNTEKSRTEITVGLGYKIPLGKYNDSTVVFINPTTGKKYYTTAPPTIQPTNGSQDFIFYGFAFKGYPFHQFRVFTNVLYIKKGWNPLGQKFGNYSSVGFFISKTFFEKLGLTLQVRGEHIGKMKYDKNIDMLALYNIDVNSTGSRKIFFAPQLSYTHNDFTIYMLSEIPLYQYVYGTQVVSQKQLTLGFSYRFYTVKSNV